jgi:hypothetical protein
MKRQSNKEYYANNKYEIAERRCQEREIKSSQQTMLMLKTWYVLHHLLDNQEPSNCTYHLQEVLFCKLATNRSHVTQYK